MKRVRFNSPSCRDFFILLKGKTQLQLSGLASELNVSAKSLSDWRCSKSKMPLDVYNKIIGTYKMLPADVQITDDLDEKHSAARLGGLKRMQLFGNPGTPEGRKKGGTISQQKNSQNGDSNFVVRKRIATPSLSTKLAEFIGVLLGDGHVNKRQVTVSLNLTTDFEYSEYVSNLAYKLFKIKPYLLPWKKTNCLTIGLSSTSLGEKLQEFGLKLGNKVKNQVDVPVWIQNSPEYATYCLRGLFDTDGCVYIDNHTVNKVLYRNIALNFTNRSIPLLNFWKKQLECLGFHPTQKTPYSVFLRREDEIKLYFQLVGTSNPKHGKKYEGFMFDKYGEVPKWS